MAKPQPDQPRLLAWQVFRSVQQGESYSHITLPAELSQSGLDARDKAFITELVYGSLRMQGHSDYAISQVSNRDIDSLDSDLLDVLRFGAYQILHMRTPAHAAVSANVELARKVIGESKASFVNALLRKISAATLEQWLAPSQYIEDPVSRWAVQYSHPEWIVSAYLDLLHDSSEVEAALAANNQPAVPTLIAWPGLITREELLAEGGTDTHHSPYGVVANKPPHEYRAIRERRAGVQDEGSQIVASAFFTAAHHSRTMLDVCAGPGGKAALLSRLCVQNSMEFFANEISPARAELVKSVVRDGQVWIGDARELAGNFDAILADVPCTGIGALRRRPEVRWRRNSSDIKNLIPLQIEISQRAISNLNPGGIFGYATCSPHLAETRSVVANLLRKNPDLEEIDVRVEIEGGKRDLAMQLWTHRHNTDAMFLALLRKKVTV